MSKTLKIKNVILLDYEPYTEYRKRIYHIDDFKKWGYNVEIWDLSSYCFKGLSVTAPSGDKHIIIRSNAELSKRIHSINVAETIFIVTSHIGWHSLKRYRMLKRNNCLFVKINVTSNYIGKPRKRFYDFKKDNEKLLWSIVDRAKDRLFKLYQRFNPIKPYFLLSPYHGLCHYWIKFNHPDYDEFYKNTTALSEECIVFLDMYFPFHPDIVNGTHLDMRHCKERYEAEMTTLFDKLEQKYRLPVIIAAHPKSNYAETKFGGRKVVYGNTVELVKRSKFVLSHGSNSISYAILGNKGVCLITTNDINRVPTYRGTLERQSEVFNIPIYNISQSINIEKLDVHRIDNIIRQNYIYSLLTKREIDKKRNDELLKTFMDSLKNYVFCPTSLKEKIIRKLDFYKKIVGAMSYVQDLLYVGHSLRGTYFNPKIKEAGGTRCQSSDYRYIRKALKHCPFTANDVIMDLGCGQGRLFHYLCANGFKGRCFGIELWKEVALKTKSELSKYENVTIVNDNFLDFDFPVDFTIVYYFNPANEEVTGKVIEKLESYHRPFRFIYVNALYSNLMKNRLGWNIKYEFDTRYRLDKKLHSIIFEYNPA